MKFGSVFTGIGGFEIGLERAGWTCAWQIENDKFCNKILAARYPDVMRYGDIKTVEGGVLERVDLLCGGFPCQDLSIAGKRAGLGGERSGLFFEFARLARELRPEWILLENVHGLLSSHEGEDFLVILEALSELGYGVAWRTLDSRFFGVAQRRRRVFIVGHLGGPVPHEVLFEREGSGGDSQPLGKTGEVVAHALRASTRGVDERTGTTYVVTEGPIAFNWQAGATQWTTPKFGITDALHAHQVPAVLRMREGKPGGGKGPLIREDESLTLATANDQVVFTKAHRAHNTTDYEKWVEAGVAPTLNGFEVTDVRATTVSVEPKVIRVTGDYANPTVKVDDLPMLAAHPMSDRQMSVYTETTVRRLTPTECERLQAFPDGWTCLCQPITEYSGSACKCADSPRYAVLGNAVTTNVVRWIGRRIAAEITQEEIAA